MGETDITELITRLTLETSQFVSAAQNHMRLVDTMKTKLRELATTANVSFKDASKSMIDSIKGWGDVELKKIFPTMDTANAREVVAVKNELISSTKQATSDLQKESEAAKGAGLSWGSLGSAMKVVMGIGIVQFLRQIWQLLVDSTKSAYDFAKATYMLATGANALRRAGVDISLRDMYENLDKLQKKFGVFSKKELVEGASAFMNLVRDMGFTKEQIFELQDAVATLAIVNGRAMDDVQRTVALALSSGYTEGLQRLGVSINRVNIALKAEELGYGRVYMTLTETQRSEATEILLLEKVAKYADDAAKYQGSLAGQIQSTTAEITDQKVAIGEGLLPIQRMWNEIVLSTLTILGGLISFLEPLIGLISGLWHVMEEYEKANQGATESLEGLNKEGEQTKWWMKGIDFNDAGVQGVDVAIKLFKSWQKLAEYLNKVWSLNGLIARIKGDGDSLKELNKQLADDLGKIWAEATPTLPEAPIADEAAIKAKEASERRMEIMEDLARQMWDLDQETKEKMLEAEKEYNDDLLKIDEDGAKKRLDIEKDWADKVLSIRNDASKSIRDARTKYDLDVIQTNRQANIRRAESEAKYRENQIKEEINYQETMKKLREGFLMDLEDALRERDALAVLRATRQYNLQKKQATREHEINVDELKRAHALELQELENARKERLQVLKEELAARIAMIIEERRLKLEEAKRERDEKLAQLPIEIQAEKDARAAKFKAEKDDIEAQAQERAEAIVAGLQKQYDMTKPELEKIAALWDSIYGPNGRTQNALDYTIKYTAAVMAYLATLESRLGSLGKGYKPPNLYNIKNPVQPKKAFGGIDYATKATSFTFGEAGPEVAITMPLTRQFSGKEFLNGNPISSILGGKKGNMEIQLLLSPDLVAKVVRQSGDMVANVLMEVQRQK